MDVLSEFKESRLPRGLDYLTDKLCEEWFLDEVRLFSLGNKKGNKHWI